MKTISGDTTECF